MSFHFHRKQVQWISVREKRPGKIWGALRWIAWILKTKMHFMLVAPVSAHNRDDRYSFILFSFIHLCATTEHCQNAFQNVMRCRNRWANTPFSVRVKWECQWLPSAMACVRHLWNRQFTFPLHTYLLPEIKILISLTPSSPFNRSQVDFSFKKTNLRPWNHLSVAWHTTSDRMLQIKCPRADTKKPLVIRCCRCYTIAPATGDVPVWSNAWSNGKCLNKQPISIEAVRVGKIDDLPPNNFSLEFDIDLNTHFPVQLSNQAGNFPIAKHLNAIFTHCEWAN